MRHVQIRGQRHAASACRRQDDEQLLTTDLRDPDIVRAKQLAKRGACRTPTGRWNSTT
jgi:hypothetical protein